MKAVIAIAIAGAVVAGVLVGFLWWGLPLQRVREDVRSLREQQVAADAAREALRTAESKLRKTEEELRLEKERSSRLEMIVSQGKK